MTSTFTPADGAVQPPVPRAELLIETGEEPDARSFASWRRSYSRHLVVTDLALIAVSAMAGQAVYRLADGGAEAGRLLVDTGASAAIVLVWAALLSWAQSRDVRVVAAGAEEYQRVFDATLRTFGGLGVLAMILRLDAARMYLLVTLPMGLLGIIVSRWAWRRWLDRQHLRGRCITKVVVLGERHAAMMMAGSFDRDRLRAYKVVGVCTPGGRPGAAQPEEPGGERDCGGTVPVFGDERSVPTAIAVTGADTVVVTATERLGDERLRELGWQLADLSVDLVVCPGVTEIARPRLTILSAADVPLLLVGEPQYRGANRLAKMTVDRAGAALALILLAPLLMVCALAVWVTSRGPVFYAAERIGMGGAPFTMIKFRSMTVGAEALVESLTAGNDGAGPMFKLREDPRVTRVGRVIRRYSLDELPQLFNVLRGEMSLVGPRPPLACEVENYTGTIRRRLRVRPGITGLWQVSGRSDLPWDESVRLDLSYVENWSFMGDVAIVWKTLRAVVTGAGAY